MIVDRHPPVNLFAVIPQRYASFAPDLQALDHLLDDDAIFQRHPQAGTRGDLARRYPHSLTAGRHSTPVEVILRMLVLKRVYRWSYEATEHFVFDSLLLRQFCRVYWEDSAVVETTIHHPTDSSLLADGVRVLSRLLRRAKTVELPRFSREFTTWS
jgi:IS5 family transposase